MKDLITNEHTSPDIASIAAKRMHDPDPEVRSMAASLLTQAGDVLGLKLDPSEQATCGPLAWLRSAVDTLAEPTVKAAASGDDPDAYDEMVKEVRRLSKGLQTAAASSSALSRPAQPGMAEALEALKRIAEATPRSMNAGTAQAMANATGAIAATALAALTGGSDAG